MMLEEEYNSVTKIGKWSGVLYDLLLPNRLKGKFHRVTIDQSYFYDLESWIKSYIHKINVVEMRMIL